MNVPAPTKPSFAADRLELLVIVLDLNAYEWGRRRILKKIPQTQERSLMTFSAYLNHVLVFMNTFLLSKQTHKIAVVATTCNKSRILYPAPPVNTPSTTTADGEAGTPAATTTSSSATDSSEKKKKKDKKKKKKPESSTNAKFIEDYCLRETNFSSVQQKLVQEIKQLVLSHDVTQDGVDNNTNTNIKSKGTSMAGSLSQALCFINRIAKEKPPGTQLDSRILVLQASPDISSQYISIMNAIFSAQRMGVSIDACVLSTEDSAFLQQAAYITDGVYMKPFSQDGLLQYLLSVYMVDKHLRGTIQLPIQSSVDFRASCFESKKPIDIGYVCSVCLSIFQQFRPICSTCNMRFTIKKKQPLAPVVKKPTEAPNNKST